MNQLLLAMSEYMRNTLQDDNLHHSHIILKGIVGAGAPMLGMTVSFVEHTEPWLRFISMIVGILVGLVTLVSLCLTVRIKIVEVKTEKEKYQRSHNQEPMI